MRFDIDPDPAESQRACVAITRSVLPTNRFGITILALYAAVYGLAAWLAPETREITAIIGVAAIMSGIALYRFEIARLTKLAQSRDLHAQETHSIELSAEGVRSWCAHVDARYPWSDFLRMVENKEFILFARPSGQGSAIPKRLLGNDTEREIFANVQAWAPQIEVTRLKA